MRLLRGQVPVVLDPATYRFEIGKAKLLVDGSDVAIISTGLMTSRALGASAELQQQGVRAAVLHVSTLKPFDAAAVLEMIGRVGKVMTAENHVVTGGLAAPWPTRWPTRESESTCAESEFRIASVKAVRSPISTADIKWMRPTSPKPPENFWRCSDRGSFGRSGRGWMSCVQFPGRAGPRSLFRRL